MPLILQQGIGCFISMAELRAKVPEEHLRKMFSQLKIRIEKKVGPPLCVQLYKSAGADIILPRRCALFLAQFGIMVENRLAVGMPISAPLVAELSANQYAVLGRLAEIFVEQRAAAGTACALLDMPPGQGKTILAAAVISHIGLRAAYIVHRKILATQTVDDFAKVGMQAAIWPETADTTIIIINSIKNVSGEFWQSIGVTVIDEIHVYTSDKRRDVFRIAMARYMLGMSGTICDRPDKPEGIYVKELCLEKECQPIVATSLADWIPDDLRFDCVVKAIRYYGREEHTQNIKHESTGVLFTPWMIKQYLADPDRQALILREVQRLLASNHTGIFVFCLERDGLTTLQRLLAEQDPFVPELSSLLMAGTKNIDVAKQARLILTTYGYSSTGISIQRMTAMVLTTPMRNGTEQVAKRIMRRGGDLAIRREIVDIIDSRTGLASQFYARRAVYERNNFTIEYSKHYPAPIEMLQPNNIEPNDGNEI